MSGLQAAGGTAITTTEHTDETSTHATTARVLVFVVAVAGYAADLATKTAALDHLDPANPPVLLGGLVTLQLISNPGAAFSMGENFTVVLSFVAIAAFVVVSAWLVPRVRVRAWGVATGLLLAGILGNLTDRLFRPPSPLHGHVIDFIQLPYFAIFNVADMCITGAAVLIIWLSVVRQVSADGRRMDAGEQEARGRASS